jgi:putative transposase
MADSPHVSPKALLRYQMLAQLSARVLRGLTPAEAIREILKLTFYDHRGRRFELSERSLYRWKRAYETDGLSGLEPKARPRSKGSEVLSADFLTFLEAEKKLDPAASVPELIRRARTQGILEEDEAISRTSGWRACHRLDLPLRRAHTKKTQDMRRFAYPHRMMMVLADGKHFRAGIKRCKRVALFLLDDATRLGLGVVVCTSEQTTLFLRALHKAICAFGLMKVLFLDNGSGFISEDTHATLARLRICLIHGTAGYPEGHGKIERFNRTVLDQCIRCLAGNPQVDPDPGALSLRLSHWLTESYNHTPHESLHGATPAERFMTDSQTLEIVQKRAWLDECFQASCERRVSADNVVKLDGAQYELPIGHAGEKICVSRHLLDNTVWIRHQGRQIQLHVVDLKANAYSRRARAKTEDQAPQEAPVCTAASQRFDADFSPVVDPDGGFAKGDQDDQDDE